MEIILFLVIWIIIPICVIRFFYVLYKYLKNNTPPDKKNNN